MFFNNLKNIGVLKPQVCVKKILNKKNHYTVLRSPVVHKKSREQFIFEKSKSLLVMTFKDYRLFFVNYFEFLMKFFFLKTLVFHFMVLRILSIS
jgi:hypothetical protein